MTPERSSRRTRSVQGEGRQADALGQLGHRDAALALQLFEDFAVDAVEFHDFTSQRCYAGFLLKPDRSPSYFGVFYHGHLHKLAALKTRFLETDMKVIVLGGGVIGVSTAYYLARAGADVTVLERESGVALETSFANAGQVSPATPPRGPRPAFR
jgi:hypothetical protein